jgi:hypothetical protein
MSSDYYLTVFFLPISDFNFGTRQNGDSIDNVILPGWCNNNPRLFVKTLRQALESSYVTMNINNWIDLIFGFKQSGKSAIDSINIYHPACYFGYRVDLITDVVHRKAIETMIKTWGQTPKQLFDSAHPQQTVSAMARPSSSHQATISFATNSVHKKVLNLKWGNYVGSPEQLPPTCIKFQKYRNKMSGIASVANSAFVLKQNECILVTKTRDFGLLIFFVFILNNY